jgi:hypothetical protein
MKIRCILQVIVVLSIATIPLFAQNGVNCFLEDFESKYAEIPSYQDVVKTSANPTVTVTINSADTLGKISKYIFGNAFPAWLGNVTTNSVLLGNINTLSPTFIRYPGGSWADIFFWSGIPKDIPDSLYDGTDGSLDPFSPQTGVNSWPTTVTNYYNMCDQVGSQGLITINYAYARYGLSENPVEQAANYAADWVRYDCGRTKFWEIGNENGGSWEAGYMIDTAKNRDGQPRIITGELYGKHFKIFARAMREAAEEIGSTIYVGGQILHYGGGTWNEGFFREVGDTADFYVMHNYFGNTAGTLKRQVDEARSEINQNISFIRQDITNKKAFSKPMAITEWNCRGPDLAKTSIANGMQAVVLLCEMMKNNFGMSARWPLVNWESDGMFYSGNNSSIPKYTPRPDFFYIYYLQKSCGDHIISASSDNIDVLAYASMFYSGHAAIVILNKGTTEQVVRLIPRNYGFGERFYIYSLAGGSDNGEFSQMVYVNGNGPDITIGGPIGTLANIPAWAYLTGDEIKFTSPAKSVQYILIEPGEHTDVSNNLSNNIVAQYKLYQNYPNPFNPSTTIIFEIMHRSHVILTVYDLLGRQVNTLLDEFRDAGKYQVLFRATSMPSGVYFYRLSTDRFVQIQKMILQK